MKVLILTKTVIPASGWGRYSLSVITELKKRGVDYEVLVEGGDMLPLRSIFDFFRNVIHIRKIAKEKDIIHAFDGWPYAVYGLCAIVGTDKRLFVNAVGTYSVAPLTDPVKSFLLKRAYKKARAVFAISEFVKNKILAHVKIPHIQTVYLGSTILPQVSDTYLTTQKVVRNITTQFPILLTVGEIKDRKGQFDTVMAVCQLREVYPHILYLIVGSDGDVSYNQKIREYISTHHLEQNVRIIADAKTDEDLSFFYTIADIFLLNSKQDGRHFEGFGLVLLEAAQFGKPVIASADSGTAEAMREGYNGYTARESDPDDIVVAVEKALAGRQSLGRNSKEFFKEFSWEKTVAVYVSLYNQE